MADESVTVLLVEDNPSDARLVREMLVDVGAAQFELVHVEQLSDALESLAQESFDVVLLDLSLPDTHGMDTLVQMYTAYPGTPVVVLTGMSDVDLAVKALQEGAQDYLVKSRVDGNSLLRSIRYAVERKRAEEERSSLLAREAAARTEAEAAHQRVLDILESINDAFVALNHQWRFTYVNREAEKILRRSWAELIDKCIWEVFPEALGSKTYREFHRAVTEQVTVESQEFILQASLWLEIRAYPAPGGLSVYLRDITERKRAEQFREEYIHNVSHDLRAPLTIIRGHANMIQRSANNVDRVCKSAEAIVTSVERMNAMIQDLVDSARLEASQLWPDIRAVSLAAFVSELLERVAGLMDSGRVKVHIRQDLPPVGADPNLLERILMNLLTNALKYSSPETEVLVRAKATGNEVVVSVADRGVGIAAEDMARIFERFYRTRGAREAEGLGLGLFIAKMLVEAQAGRIWGESEPGKGSAFSFTIPIAKPNVSQQQGH
ncbi:MAG: response regulator [Chloroflexi bacterium]|nr:response regulator [Chloroflexota bacterium]